MVASGRSSGGTTPSPQGLPKRRRSRSAEKAKAATGGNGEYLAGGKRSAASGHSRIRVRRTEAGGGGELLKSALCWRRFPEAGRKNRQADGGGGGRTESGPPAGKRKPATGRAGGRARDARGEPLMCYQRFRKIDVSRFIQKPHTVVFWPLRKILDTIRTFCFQGK